MQKTRRLDRCPRRAVAAIGGVPRLIVRDKAKVVVIKGLTLTSAQDAAD